MVPSFRVCVCVCACESSPPRPHLGSPVRHHLVLAVSPLGFLRRAWQQFRMKSSTGDKYFPQVCVHRATGEEQTQCAVDLLRADYESFKLLSC